MVAASAGMRTQLRDSLVPDRPLGVQCLGRNDDTTYPICAIHMVSLVCRALWCGTCHVRGSTRYRRILYTRARESIFRLACEFHTRRHLSANSRCFHGSSCGLAQYVLVDRGTAWLGKYIGFPFLGGNWIRAE